MGYPSAEGNSEIPEGFGAEDRGDVEGAEPLAAVDLEVVGKLLAHRVAALVLLHGGQQGSNWG